MVTAKRFGDHSMRAIAVSVAALAVLVQFRLWDLAQLMFRLIPGVPGENFYLAEGVRLLVAAVLIVPSASRRVRPARSTCR